MAMVKLENHLSNLQTTLPNSPKDYRLTRTVSKSYIDLLPTGKAATAAQVGIEITKIKEGFNIKPAAADMLAEIFLDDFWSLERIQGARKHVAKNIENNFPVQPAAFLAYNPILSLYTQNQALELSTGTGTQGFYMIKTPFERIANTGNPTTFWYIRDEDADKVPKEWENEEIPQNNLLESGGK
jgi:hypothetical protein